MTVKTYRPRTILQVPSEEIAFTDGDAILDSTQDLNTVQPVYAVATSSGRLAAHGSQSLIFKNFGITVDTTVLGIELLLHVDRLARVQDRTIQLVYNGSTVGSNQADLTAANLHVYGSPTDLWSTTDIDFSGAEFGVLIDLQPHTQYPSNNLVYLRTVELKVYTA